MPRLALQLGEVLEHLVGGGLVDMAVVVGDKFDELLHLSLIHISEPTRP